jgi:Kelch motif protein
MKTLHFLVAGLRPVSSILARRVAFPLLVLGTGLTLVQPCAGASFVFEETDNLTTVRSHHTATLLANGKVLAVGGDDRTAELYDPASGSWAATGHTDVRREAHTATLLTNGKVLVAGGQNEHGILASASLYDPVAGTWTSTGDLTTERERHTATLLRNGKVLVVGGAMVSN